MAQTGYTPLQIYSSSTASAAPAAGNLTNSTLGSELAINITDGKLFYKDNAGVVQVIAWKVTPATAGGTGQTSYAVGDLLYADTTTSLAKLADVATGNALISGGVGVAPAWGKIGLTTHVSGILPTANGGTNLSSFTANGVLYASSTSALATSSNFVYDGTNLGVGGAPTSASNYAFMTVKDAGTFSGAVHESISNAVTVRMSAIGASTIGSIGTISNHPFYIITNSTNALYFKANGVAGFNTTAPQDFLSAGYGTATINGSSGGIMSLTTANAEAARIQGYGGSSAGVLDLSAYGASGYIRMRPGNATNTTFFASGGAAVGGTTDPGAGNLRIDNGNLIQGTAGKGINFTANANAAGMTSELLNWYEEGTWTPTLTGSTTNPTVTYGASTAGFYTRVGRAVHVKCRIDVSTYSGGSGTLQISGLPFQAKASSGQYVMTAFSSGVNWGAGSTQLIAWAQQGLTNMFLWGTQNNGANYDVVVGDVSAGDIIMINGTYFTD